ncbi:MAG TPA: hypothetical protein GXZ96_05215 [Firmicutes bacterium]|jgi:hypothetical protein|nr:hypothetical protein [Bacillota bacterium]
MDVVGLSLALAKRELRRAGVPVAAITKITPPGGGEASGELMVVAQRTDQQGVVLLVAHRHFHHTGGSRTP